MLEQTIRRGIFALVVATAFASGGCVADDDETADSEENDSEPVESESTSEDLSIAGCTVSVAAPVPTIVSAYRVRTSGRIACPNAIGNVAVSLQVFYQGTWQSLSAAPHVAFYVGRTYEWNTWLNAFHGVRSTCTTAPTRRYYHRIRLTTSRFVTYSPARTYCFVRA